MGNTILNRQTKRRYELVKSLLKNSSEKIIVDIGAGGNPVSKGIKTKKTITIDGVPDFNPSICCDFSKRIPLENDSCDTIIACEIIEHIFSPYRFIRECNRILKNKGKIIISTPNLNSLKNRIKVLLGKLPEYCAEPLDDESYERHIIDFNLKRLETVARECGFKITRRLSNGIVSHGRFLWPLWLTPVSFGETIIIEAEKIKEVSS